MRQTRNCSLEMFQGYQDDKGLLFRNRSQQEKKKGTHLNLARELKGRKQKPVSRRGNGAGLLRGSAAALGAHAYLNYSQHPKRSAKLVSCRSLCVYKI